jgi:hypothetical protein
MTVVVEDGEVMAENFKKMETEKIFFQVFLGFKNPNGGITMFSEGSTIDCGVYDRLGEIFHKPPRVIYESICNLVYKKGEAFMQEYLTLESASGAVAKASLFANTAKCTCFLIQQAFFEIKEVKK